MIAIAKSDIIANVQILTIRGGKLIGRDQMWVEGMIQDESELFRGIYETLLRGQPASSKRKFSSVCNRKTCRPSASGSPRWLGTKYRSVYPSEVVDGI